MTKGGARSVWLFKVLLGLCRCPLVSPTHKQQKVIFGRDLVSLHILWVRKLRHGKEQRPEVTQGC